MGPFGCRDLGLRPGRRAGSAKANAQSAHPIERNRTLPPYQIFFIRAILAAALSVIITRVFFQRIDPVYVAGMTVFLVGGAYVSEYFRRRDRGGK